MKIFQTTRGKLLGGVAGLALLAGIPAALAQTQTTADTTISITIAETVAISNLAGIIPFASWDNTGNEQMTDDLCVWSNDGSPGQYGVLLTTDNGSMVLRQGSDEIPFTVAWANTTGQTSGTNVPYNAVTNFTMSATTTPTCGGGDNSTIIIDILETDLAAAPASTTAYDAVLTVEVSAVP